MQPINLSGVSVEEVEELGWEIPTDMSAWQEHPSNNLLKISYLQDTVSQVALTIAFPEPVNYELLLRLINNPKHRLQWDNSIHKMIVFIGDDILDGKVSCTYRNLNTSEVFERVVRNVEGFYYILYRQYDERTKGNYTVFKFAENGEVLQAFFKLRIANMQEFLEKKKEWAESLYKEILFRTCYSNIDTSISMLEYSISNIDNSIDLTTNSP